MRNRFQNFMEGRYGNDRLNQVLCFAALALAIIDIFVNINIIWYIAVVILVIVFWRMLSRNTTQRAIENDRFLAFFSRFRRGGGRYGGGGYGGGGYNGGGYGGRGYGGQNAGAGANSYTRQENAERKRAQRQDKRYYKFYNCPNCNQKVRVPKGKGRIEITCPKCHTSFIRKT